MDVRWLAGGHARTVAEADLPEVLARDDGFVWIDLDHTEAAGMALLGDRFRFHPLAVGECRTRTPVPKVHLYPDHVFLAFNGLARGTDGDLHFQPLKAFVGDRFLVTVLGPTNDALPRDVARHPLSALGRRLADDRHVPPTVLDLAHAISVTVLRDHEELVGTLATRVTDLEQRVKRCDPVRSEALLDELFAVRHELQALRTNAAQARELFAGIADSIGSAEGATLLRDLSQGFDHLTRSTDLEREYLQELLDLFQTRTANELNRFVRQITAWGAIGLAGTLVTGVYGMNFRHMPELDWYVGYPMALGLMVTIGVALAFVFRRRGWL